MKTVADLIEALKALPPDLPLVEYLDAEQYQVVDKIWVTSLELNKTDQEGILKHSYKTSPEAVKCAVVALGECL